MSDPLRSADPIAGALAADGDAAWMRQAIRLAMRGRGAVEPNPMVGCEIVRGDRIIGQGYHQKFGGPHAEPIALADCREDPAGATAYVTLEPCCHASKKTPPCVPALMAAKLKRIVIGTIDPNPLVSGNGVAQLRAAGIEVITGVCEAEARQLIAPYLCLLREKRPYVTLKWAETADGKIAGAGGKRLRITNAASDAAVQRLRAGCDAILVGIGTVLTDDPLLTVRGQSRSRPLTRLVLDSDLRMPLTSQLVRTAGESPVVVICSPPAIVERSERVRALREKGLDVHALPAEDARHLSIPALFKMLGERNFTHLLVEPGPTLAGSFLKHDLADRVWVFRSPNRLNDPRAPSAAPLDYPPAAEIALTGSDTNPPDHLTEYLNPRSQVYFGQFPSADIINLG